MGRFTLSLGVLAAFASGVAVTWLVMHRGASERDAPPSSAVLVGEKKVLYWFDPMQPQQHFDHPGKSPYMDMQLVPKYANATAGDSGTLRIDPRDVQNLGVRTARATRGTLASMLRATGTLAFDERAVAVVQSRVPGIVEKVFVREPLAHVKQGEALLSLTAPDWTAAQAEYLSLRHARASGLGDLRDAARQRLVLLGMSEAQIHSVDRSGRAQTLITISAPRAGVIGELAVREGATVAAGAPLMTINGLDTIWMNAAIPEARVGRVRVGAAVKAELPAFPGETFDGTIDALLPAVDATTRTLTARIVLANPTGRLAPGMFARVEIASAKASDTVLIPSEAVIATGTRNVVIVDEGDGRFGVRQVRIGDESGAQTAILEGVDAGDNVVLSGQFLIDSEASLSGTLARLEGGHDEKAQTAPAAPPAHAEKQ